MRVDTKSVKNNKCNIFIPYKEFGDWYQKTTTTKKKMKKKTIEQELITIHDLGFQ